MVVHEMAGRKRNRWDSDSDDEAPALNPAASNAKKKQKESDKISVDAEPARPTAGSPTELPQDQENDREDAVHNFYLHGCRSVDNYKRIGKIDEGTYGVVSKAQDKVTGDIVALKQVKMSADVCHEGFPVTALRETNVLLALQHPNIVPVREMVVGSTPDKIFMVMEYSENDLKTVMEAKMKQPFLQAEVKYLLRCLLRAVAFMHDRWYIHRDLKTSNLLYDKHGCLKVCDFGLARKYGSPIRSYTQLVVTLWYRAPELLLGATTYSTAVDMWSVGCIFAEMLLMKPLLPGRGEIDQMDQIFRLLGSPSPETWPDLLKDCPNAQNIKWKWPKKSKLQEKFSPLTGSFASSNTCSLSSAGLDLMRRLLSLDPKQRISAKDALEHEYFREAPLPQDQAAMPVFHSPQD